MNKEQLLKLIEETENELKKELKNTFIEKRTRVINIEFLETWRAQEVYY